MWQSEDQGKNEYLTYFACYFFFQKCLILNTYLPILDDSDEEDKAKTDESEDSEIEFELGADETIEKLIADQLEKLGIPEQIDLGINNVSER